MLIPLLIMALAFTTYFGTVLIVRMRTEIVARKVRALQIAQVERGQPTPPPLGGVVPAG